MMRLAGQKRMFGDGQMKRQQQPVKLVGEQFVVGEAAPMQAERRQVPLAAGAVQRLQGLAPRPLPHDEQVGVRGGPKDLGPGLEEGRVAEVGRVALTDAPEA